MYNSGMEHHVLDRVLEPLTRGLPRDAGAIADFRVDPETQTVIDALADKCSEGRLSPDERREYESYVEAIDILRFFRPRRAKRWKTR